MTSEAIYHLLGTTKFGAYAMDREQTILFWNGGAERILGHRAQEVVGRRCCDVIGARSPGESALGCQGDCPSLHHFRLGLIPPTFQLRMLCSSGERRLVGVIPVAVADVMGGNPVLFHVFYESADAPGAALGGAPATTQAVDGPAVPARAKGLPVTRRELEVLRLVSLGREIHQIADALNLSHHTVLNHIRNSRRKLQAPTKMDAVLTAMRRGLL